MTNKNNSSSSYTKYHKAYNEKKESKKFTMELSNIEHFSLHEYAKFKKIPIKALLLQVLEKTMFNDVNFISFLIKAGNPSKSMNALYQAEQKRLIDEQKTRKEQAEKEEAKRLKKIEKAKLKENQRKALNIKPKVNKVETTAKSKKKDNERAPVKNHRMKILSGIAPTIPDKITKPEKTVTGKVSPVKQPQQMSILEEVAKVTEKDMKSKKPINKAKNSRQAEGKDKQEFGPGSKGVSNSVKAKK